MTFIPINTKKNCFIACPQEKIDAGLCSCVNNSYDKVLNKTLPISIIEDTIIYVYKENIEKIFKKLDIVDVTYISHLIPSTNNYNNEVIILYSSIFDSMELQSIEKKLESYVGVNGLFKYGILPNLKTIILQFDCNYKLSWKYIF